MFAKFGRSKRQPKRKAKWDEVMQNISEPWEGDDDVDAKGTGFLSLIFFGILEFSAYEGSDASFVAADEVDDDDETKKKRKYKRRAQSKRQSSATPRQRPGPKSKQVWDFVIELKKLKLNQKISSRKQCVYPKVNT